MKFSLIFLAFMHKKINLVNLPWFILEKETPFKGNDYGYDGTFQTPMIMGHRKIKKIQVNTKYIFRTSSFSSVQNKPDC